jgi:hypothetical protein
MHIATPTKKASSFFFVVGVFFLRESGIFFAIAIATILEQKE